MVMWPVVVALPFPSPLSDDDKECACVANGPIIFIVYLLWFWPHVLCAVSFMFSFSFHRLTSCERVCVCVCYVYIYWFAHLCVTNKFSKINKDNNPFECIAIELFTVIGCPLVGFDLLSALPTHTYTLLCMYVQHLFQHCAQLEEPDS